MQGMNDLLVITESKKDSTFPSNQFAIQVYSKLYRFERNRNGCCVWIHVQEDIPSRELKIHNTPEDIESNFIEINLIKLCGFFVNVITHLASVTNTSLKILEKR